MNTDNTIIIIGAGGHSKVVISTLLAIGAKIAGIYDDDASKWGGQIWGIPIYGATSQLNDYQSGPALIAIGNNVIRKEIAQRYKNINWFSIIHPAAYVHPTVKIGKGSVIFAGAVIQPDTVIGEHCIINTGAVIDHDCVIGDYSHVAPGTHLAGGVRVGEGVLFGIGSAAIPKVHIGEWTTVGAGGVVVKDIPAGEKVAGIPAKPIE